MNWSALLKEQSLNTSACLFINYQMVEFKVNLKGCCVLLQLLYFGTPSCPHVQEQQQSPILHGLEFYPTPEKTLQKSLLCALIECTEH